MALADLAAFFRDPVKGFFRALDYTLPWEIDGVEDAMPVDINALEEWTVGDRMLRDMLDGMDPIRRGTPSGGAAPCRPAGWDGARPPRSATRPTCWPRRPGTTVTPNQTPSTSTSTSAPGGG